MRVERFADERIDFALRQDDGGAPAGGIRRKMGVSEAAFHRWTTVRAGKGVAGIWRLERL